MLINKLKFFYRKILSKDIRTKFRKIFKFILYNFRFLKLKLYLALSRDVKLILGAALTSNKSWISTNEEWFDITRKHHWDRLFHKKKFMKRALAEHVFEHLTEEEMAIAFKFIYEHLASKGTLRIAVPDGNNPNPEYIKNTGINGIGADASDHKQFIKFEYLKSELEKVGFKCFIREGYKSNGELVNEKLPPELGYIIRSRRNSFESTKEGWDFVDANSSLIVDAYK